MLKSAPRKLTLPAVLGLAVGFAAVTLITVDAQQTTTPALDDPTIVAIFDAANSYDMETGALAARKARSTDVREYGAMLLRDHRHARTLGRDLAKSLNVTPTPPKDFPLAKAHADAMRNLQKAAARDFDRAFLAHEVAFHSAVIDAITTTLMPAIQNAEVKALVTKVAPAFVAHRDKAKSMLDNLK